MIDFQKLKDELPRKESLYSSLTDKKITDTTKLPPSLNGPDKCTCLSPFE